MSSATVTPREPKSEQEVLGTYRQMQSEMQGLIQNLTKIEMDRNEHRLVEETLTPLDPDRRAFRLVGGVLVERTVREVLPTVREHRGNVRLVFLLSSLFQPCDFLWSHNYNYASLPHHPFDTPIVARHCRSESEREIRCQTEGDSGMEGKI